MREAEFKIVAHVIRVYFGYHRTEPVPIDYEAFRKHTGLSQQGVRNGITNALASGRILRFRGDSHTDLRYIPGYLPPESISQIQAKFGKSTKQTQPKGDESTLKTTGVHKVEPHNIKKATKQTDNADALLDYGPELAPRTKWGHWIGFPYWYIRPGERFTCEVLHVEVIGESKQRVRVKYPDGRIATVAPKNLTWDRPALERKTTAIQDVIAWHCFGLDRQAVVSPALQTHLNTITGTIEPALGDHMPTPGQLHAMYEEYPKHLTKPSKAPAILGMINSYKESNNGRSNGKQSTRSPRRAAQNGSRGGSSTTAQRGAAPRRDGPPQEIPGVDYSIPKTRIDPNTGELLDYS